MLIYRWHHHTFTYYINITPMDPYVTFVKKKSRWSSVFAQLFAMQKRISGSRWLCLGTCFLRTGFHSCLRPTRKDLKGEQPNSQSFSSTKAIHVINWPGQAGFALHSFAFIQWHVIVIKSIESRLGKLLCFGSLKTYTLIITDQCMRIEYDALPLALLLSHILHTGYHCQRCSNILKSLCLWEPERMGGSPSKQLQHSTSQSQMQEVYTNWKSLPQGPGCLCNWGALALLGFPRLLGIMASGPGWMP